MNKLVTNLLKNCRGSSEIFQDKFDGRSIANIAIVHARAIRIQNGRLQSFLQVGCGYDGIQMGALSVDQGLGIEFGGIGGFLRNGNLFLEQVVLPSRCPVSDYVMVKYQ